MKYILPAAIQRFARSVTANTLNDCNDIHHTLLIDISDIHIIKTFHDYFVPWKCSSTEDQRFEENREFNLDIHRVII